MSDIAENKTASGEVLCTGSMMHSEQCRSPLSTHASTRVNYRGAGAATAEGGYSVITGRTV